MSSRKGPLAKTRKLGISLPENASFFAKEVFRAFQERVSKNPRYSMRAFSRSLGISPSWLLRMLRDERAPSVSMVQAIATKLAWSKTVSGLALREIVNSASTRKLSAMVESASGADRDTRWIGEEDLPSIADPVSLAIRELPELSGFLLTPESAARELGISVDDAEKKINHLVESGALEPADSGTFQKSNAWMHAKDRDRTTARHQALVQRLLAHASSHVSETSWGERLNYWGMYAIDPDEIPKVKPIIEQFLIDIEAILGGRERKKVYTAGFYLCPAEVVPSQEASHDS